MSWITILAQEHKLDQPIPARFVPVIDKLRWTAIQNGYTIYAVGGFVRDVLMGHTPNDFGHNGGRLTGWHQVHSIGCTILGLTRASSFCQIWDSYPGYRRRIRYAT